MKHNVFLVLLILVLGNAAHGAAYGKGDQHSSPHFQNTGDFSVFSLTPQQAQDDSPGIVSDFRPPELSPVLAKALPTYRHNGVTVFNGKSLCIRGPPSNNQLQTV